jgi:hypothetical protein
MRSRRLRWCLVGGTAVLGLAGSLAVLGWALLRHRPDFYLRVAAGEPAAEQRREARAFLNSSLQLRNDVTNEPAWEAEFSDREVNAWLARDLVEQFADLIPPGVAEPRVVFEPGRLTLACDWHREPLDAVVWAVLQVHVPEPNTLVLTVEKLRAGALPIPAEQVLPNLMAHARRYGLDASWERTPLGDEVRIRYGTDAGGEPAKPAAVRLEEIQLGLGTLRLSGRTDSKSSPRGSRATVRLPSRDQLESAFHRKPGSGTKRTIQSEPEDRTGPGASMRAVEVEASLPRDPPRS